MCCNFFQNVVVKYNVFVKEMRKELEPLVSQRDKIVAELKRLQRENDTLVKFWDFLRRHLKVLNFRIGLRVFLAAHRRRWA